MKLRERRTVEIYFILYLAALVFLLPGKKEPANNSNNADSMRVAEGEFSVHPVKTTLSCRLSMDDGVNPRVITFDSLNTIVYSGNVEDVKFEFVVEDQSLRQKLTLSAKSETSSAFFRMEEHPEQQSATFYWLPPLFERTNKTYIVTVIATATPRNSGMNNSAPTNKLTARTQFSLNMIYLNNNAEPNGFPLAATDSIRNNFYYPPLQQIYSSSEIDIRPLQNDIRQTAQYTWTNQIDIYGSNYNPDWLKNASVSVVCYPEDNGGTATIQSTSPNKIILSGKTPSNGKMKVMFSLASKSTGKTVSVDFNVSPLLIGIPKYEQEMYPDKTYNIDPNMPMLKGRDVRAYIKDNRGIRIQSEQGERLQFTPDISDTGHILSLERYIDGSLFGQKYQIRVLGYPNPVISSVQVMSSNEIRIITYSYGYINRKENLCDIEAIGNVNAYEVRGSMPKSPDDITHVQIFKCLRKDQSKPFIFKVRAIDKRGKASPYKNVND